jgi:dihydrofolate reductase
MVFTDAHIPQDVRTGRRDRHRRRFRGARLRQRRRLDHGAQHVRSDPWRLAGRELEGWWGNNPPYHCPVFVLTHYPRASIPMEGGTTFHFVTDGIHAALERAREAANGKDIRLGGGVATVRQYLQAGLIDEMHLAVSPMLLGSGENLFAGLDFPKLGLRVSEHVAAPKATHIVLTKQG